MPTMRIQCLQHVPFEGPAAIGEWAQARGHRLELVPLYQGASPPPPAEFDWLLVMGGPMGVLDEQAFPWLIPEKAAIAAAIDADKGVIGVCLGAQLIASALGARVYRNPEKEIGWLPIEVTAEGAASRLFGPLAPDIEVFQWHGDTFDLPAGAVHLARSTACEHQAFAFGEHVLALQFHLESTPATVAALVSHCADEIVPARYVQDAERMLAADPEDFERIRGALFGLLDRLAERATGVASSR